MRDRESRERLRLDMFSSMAGRWSGDVGPKNWLLDRRRNSWTNEGTAVAGDGQRMRCFPDTAKLAKSKMELLGQLVLTGPVR